MYVVTLLQRSTDAERQSELTIELDKLLAERVLSEAILDWFAGSPLPAQADLDGAARIAAEAGAQRTAELLRKLQAQRVAVEMAWLVWERWSADHFPTRDQAAVIRDWFRAHNGWRALVTAIQTGNRQGFAVWCLRVARQAPLGANAVRLLNRLTEQIGLLQPSADHREASGSEGVVAGRAEPAEEDGGTLRKRPPRLNAAGIFEVVQLQLQAIVRAIERQDDAKASEFLYDLIQYHLVNGGPRYLVKSLSNLAAQARRRGALDFAQHCCDLSVRYAPEDLFSRNGRAAVLKAQGKLPEALVAYDAIIAEFGGNPTAHSGRAEVLKAQGKLPEALAAYDAIIVEFPDNVVARNGRAEVLKAQGRLPEALAAYDLIISEFGSDVVARNGRAEVLKAQGRLSDALAAYDAIISEHPDKVIARTGRAEVLKCQGRLADALAAYDLAIRLFPDNVIARRGRAEVLRCQGKLAESVAKR